jgi:hypothetical protein
MVLSAEPAPYATADPLAPPAPVDVEARDETQQPRRDWERTRRCPSCDARIDRRAIRCRYCGSRLRPIPDSHLKDLDDPSFQPRDCEPHRGPTVLLLGIGSLVVPFLCFGLAIFGLPLGIVAWVMGQRDLRRMDAGEVDNQGRGSTQAGMVCGIIGTVLSGIACMVLVGLVSLFVLAAQASKSAPAPAPARPFPVAPPRPGHDELLPRVFRDLPRQPG